MTIKYGNFASAVGNLAEKQKEKQAKSKEWRRTLSKEEEKKQSRALRMHDHQQQVSSTNSIKIDEEEWVEAETHNNNNNNHSSTSSSGAGGGLHHSSSSHQRKRNGGTASSSGYRSSSAAGGGGSNYCDGTESIRSVSEDVATQIEDYEREEEYTVEPSKRCIGRKPNQENTDDGIFWIKPTEDQTVKSYKEIKEQATAAAGNFMKHLQM